MALIPNTRWFRLATPLLALGLAAGCGNGTKDGDTARDAAIYRSVIDDVADRSSIVLEDGQDIPLLFIEPLAADGIPLQVQVEVVSGFIEQYEIRFIDHRDEAVEVDLPGLPVRDGSILIGLGAIVVDGTADVRGELYVSADEVRAYGYTLLPGGGEAWDIVGDPVPIEPEGLVLES